MGTTSVAASTRETVCAASSKPFRSWEAPRDAFRAHSKDAVIDLLRQTGEQAAKRLRGVDDQPTTQPVPTLNGVESRLAAPYCGVAQGMYHRGTITVYRCGFETVPALARQISAMPGR